MPMKRALFESTLAIGAVALPALALEVNWTVGSAAERVRQSPSIVTWKGERIRSIYEGMNRRPAEWVTSGDVGVRPSDSQCSPRPEMGVFMKTNFAYRAAAFLFCSYTSTPISYSCYPASGCKAALCYVSESGSCEPHYDEPPCSGCATDRQCA